MKKLMNLHVAVFLASFLTLGAALVSLTPAPALALVSCEHCKGGSQLCCTDTWCVNWVGDPPQCSRWVTFYFYQNPPKPEL